MCSFLFKNLLAISFGTKLWLFWFSTFRNSKNFCTFTGVYITIYMGPCRRSYILLVRKFQTSEMLDKWSSTSKLSGIKLSTLQTVDIFFSFVQERTCLPHPLNLFYDIIKSFLVFVIIEFWISDIMPTLPIKV